MRCEAGRRVGAQAGRWAIVLLAIWSCEGSTRLPADPAASRDSAGITIIASAAPVWAEGRGWAVADSPTVDIAGIGSPGGALRLSDGRIVVADGRPVGLLYFGREGRALYDVGLASDGKDQLRSIYHLDLGRADTVVVYDLVRRRVLFFDPNGALARTIPIAERLTPAGSNGFLPKGLTPDGRYLFQRDEVDFPFAGPAGALLTDSTRLFWTSGQGTFTDSSARLVAGELFGFTLRAGRDQRIITPLARPLAPALRVVAGPDRVWAGDGATWEVRGFGVHGEVVRILRVARQTPPLPDALRDTFLARFRARVASAGSASIPRQFAEGMGSAPFPERLPAFSELMAGEDSTLWAQHVGLIEGLLGDASLVWTVFDPGGRWLGEVTMPQRFRPYAAGRGWILGVQLDAAEAPHVRLYPLVER